jgi:hypothetical protein
MHLKYIEFILLDLTVGFDCRINSAPLPLHMQPRHTKLVLIEKVLTDIRLS